MREIIEVNTDNLEDVDVKTNIFDARAIRAGYNTRDCDSEVSILVWGFNNLEKTKACVKSIFTYTTDIDYDLWLIDNGSSDETFEYFKTVEYDKLHILHITSGKGTALPWMYLNVGMFGRYVAVLNNDLVLTKNWLKNLLTVAKSDPKIGMVNPVSSNTSNNQEVMLEFANDEEMQEKAAAYNVSDPKKWHERLRLLTLGTLYTKECLMAVGLPLADPGFLHNFGDDDITFRVRRAGYKAVLACDTWIHHNDYKSRLSQEELNGLYEKLGYGRGMFREKYFGIDAWDDVTNFIKEYISALTPVRDPGNASVLGIDVKCGTPILEIKNYLRSFDTYNANTYAFTTDGKYYTDLQTICGADHVRCEAVDRLTRAYARESFDKIVIGKDINTYNEPFNVITDAMDMLKPGGQLFLSLFNTQNVFELFRLVSPSKLGNDRIALNYSIEYFMESLMNRGYNIRFLSGKVFSPNAVGDDMKTKALSMLQALNAPDPREALYRLCSERYYFVIAK